MISGRIAASGGVASHQEVDISDGRHCGHRPGSERCCESSRELPSRARVTSRIAANARSQSLPTTDATATLPRILARARYAPMCMHVEG